jgi:hypothetical protein
MIEYSLQEFSFLIRFKKKNKIRRRRQHNIQASK